MPRVRAVFALSALMTLSETGCSESKDLGQPVLFTFGLSPIDGALDACVGGVDGAEGTLAFTNESDWTVRISLSHQSGLAFSPSDLAVAPHQSGRVAWKLTRDVPPFVVSALWDHGWSWNATVPVRASIDESLFRIEDAKVDALGQSPGRVTIANTASISGSVSVGGRGPVVPSQIEVLVAAKSSAEVGYALTREAARGEHGENVEGALQIHAGNCGRAQEMPLADVRVTGRSSRVAKQIVAGRSHTCALADDGSVHCWGSNSESELGIGAKSSLLSRPMPIMELAGGVTALAAGFFQTLALRDGKVFCWGGLSGEACGGISGDAPARPTEVPLPACALVRDARRRPRILLGEGHCPPDLADGDDWSDFATRAGDRKPTHLCALERRRGQLCRRRRPPRRRHDEFIGVLRTDRRRRQLPGNRRRRHVHVRTSAVRTLLGRGPRSRRLGRHAPPAAQ